MPGNAWLSHLQDKSKFTDTHLPLPKEIPYPQTVLISECFKKFLCRPKHIYITVLLYSLTEIIKLSISPPHHRQKAANQKVTTLSPSFIISYISFMVDIGHIADPSRSLDLIQVPQA